MATLRELWEEEWKKASPDLQHYMNYAVEVAKEEFGIKPRGSTPSHQPLPAITEDDLHSEPRID